MTLNIADCPYRDEIDTAMRAYLPTWAPMWGPAQLWQESNWIPTAHNARSGAMGLAQFMPDTWDEMVTKMGYIDVASAYDPVYAIPAYARYMRDLSEQWTAKRSYDDRRKLTQASYNCGFGNMLKAQKLANGALDYASIIAQLPHVTGPDNAHETTDYVAKIEYWFAELTQGSTA